MLFALLANAGSAFAYAPPATYGPESMVQPQGGSGDEGGEKKGEKKGKKGGKKGGKKADKEETK